MKTMMRVAAVMAAVLILSVGIGAAAQEAPLPAMPYEVEQITGDDFAASSSAADKTTDQTSASYMYENDVLEIEGGFWRIHTSAPSTARIVISGSAGVILDNVEVIAEDGAALTIVPGVTANIVLAQGSVNHLVGAVSAPGVLVDSIEAPNEQGSDDAEDAQESDDAQDIGGLIISGCGCLTIEGGSGAEAVQGAWTDLTTADPLEAGTDSENMNRITVIDSSDSDPAEDLSDPETQVDVEEALADPEAHTDAEEAPADPEAHTDAEEAPADPEAHTDAEEAPADPEEHANEVETPTDPEMHADAEESTESVSVADVSVPEETGEVVTASAQNAQIGEKVEANTTEPEEEEKDIHFSVKISWEDADNQDGTRPSFVNVVLYANGEESGRSVSLHSDNDWTADFDSLPVKKDGDYIAYSIVEDSIDGYSASISGSTSEGYTITNSHQPAPKGRSAQEEIGRIKEKAEKEQEASRPTVTTVTTRKVSTKTTNYGASGARTSTTITKTRSPKTADPSQPALWTVPLLIGVAGLYIWVRREEK